MATSLVALAVRALTLLVIFEIAGPAAITHPFSHLKPWWVTTTGVAEALTYLAYVLVYESVARYGNPVAVRLATLARIVLAGFGPVSLSGGFGVDRTAWEGLAGDAEGAAARVGAVAVLEWAVLAPVAWLAAVLALATGADVAGSLLWPWAIGVPVGVLAAGWATGGDRPHRLARPRGRQVAGLAHVLEGVRAVRTMAGRPRRYAGAWAGTALYWAAEVASLYGALRAVGLDIGVLRTVLAYATGYLASRRSLPLGGAGLAEGLLVFSLYELHEPLGPAVAAVLVYRGFNFVLVVVPALIAYRGLPSISLRSA